MSKTFYWLKLKQGYFATRAMKKMRKSDNGETMTIVYLKLQLEAIATEGIIPFYGFEENISEELALAIDEDAEDIQATLDFLLNHGMATISDSQLCLPEVIENTGKETDAAERMRRFRARQRGEDEACNNVTESYVDVTQRESTEDNNIKIERELGELQNYSLSGKPTFTLENAWHLTVDKYPRKTNYGNAYELWLEMVGTDETKQSERALEIYRVVCDYAAEYERNNTDFPDGSRALGFGKWLKDEYAIWLKRRKDYFEQQKQTMATNFDGYLGYVGV